MSTLQIQNSPRNHIVTILHIFRMYFEAAVAAHRPPSVTNFSQRPGFIRVRRDYKRRGDIPAWTPQDLAQAYKKWNLCDTFCSMIFRPLCKHVQGCGGRVYWKTRPYSATFVFGVGDEKPEPIAHSVLVVQMPEGDTLVFDCTGEQFGWPAFDWLKKQEANVSLAWKDFDDEYDEHETRLLSLIIDQGYWLRVIARFEEIWDGLQWEDLKTEDPKNLEALINGPAAERAESAALETWGKRR